MTVHAPYNFVTLSRFIYSPPWKDRISHDIPFSDGLSGEFDITITAHSKILVGGERGKQGDIQTVDFFRLPDGEGHEGKGTWAIPERSLRGMIRNVLEIASFGRMKYVHDRRLGVRDLTAPAKDFYGRRLFDSVGVGPARVTPKVEAGWLWFDGKGWKITPCQWARVHFDELGLITGTVAAHWARKENADDCRDPADPAYRGRYGRWRETGKPLQQHLWVHEPLEHPHAQHQPPNRKITVKYRKAFHDNPRNCMAAGRCICTVTQKLGHIVLTGTPQGGMGPGRKKQEFFFYDAIPDNAAISVDQPVYDGFKAIHEPEGGDPNPNWAYWRDRSHQIRRTGSHGDIPVFYIMENGKVASFGLAMMFKLAYENSIHEMIERTDKEHLNDDIVDLSTAIFGLEADERDAKEREKKPHAPGLKSRVHLGLAKCGYEDANGNWQCGKQPKPIKETPTILAGPKPSYFPSYVRQPTPNGNSGQLSGNTYATYTPISGSDRPKELSRPELRGWKRYPVGRQDNVPPAGEVSNEVKVCLRPLPEGTQFRSKVRFHNLRPIELGALLWALEWGAKADDRANFCHRLGMGKPYGYGRVRIEAKDINPWPNDEQNKKLLDKAGYIACFEKEMERAYTADPKRKKNGGSWAESEQIKLLLAMADPAKAAGKSLNYMRLEVPGVNQFQQAKSHSEVLPEYLNLSSMNGKTRDHDLWPRPAPAQTAQPQKPKGGGDSARAQTKPAGAPQKQGLSPEEMNKRLEALRKARER